MRVIPEIQYAKPMAKHEKRTIRRSAVTPSKATFRRSNIDFLKPQWISFPTVYNMNCSLFDTNMTPIPWTSSTAILGKSLVSLLTPITPM